MKDYGIKSGDIFENWTVVSKSEEIKDNRICFICQCECGYISHISGRNLINGKSKSCNHCKNAKDISKEKFGMLTPIKRIYLKNRYYWLCKCDCGNYKTIRTDCIKKGKLLNCGCIKRESTNRKYKYSDVRLYQIWFCILKRCYNNKSKAYENYGGRGIKVCKDWKNYDAFAKWALNNGYNDTLTIDRINNDGNYEPDNCRFVTKKENGRNRRFLKLNQDKVKDIKELLKTNISQRNIAKKYDVAESVISRIKTGSRWG